MIWSEERLANVLGWNEEKLGLDAAWSALGEFHEGLTRELPGCNVQLRQRSSRYRFGAGMYVVIKGMFPFGPIDVFSLLTEGTYAALQDFLAVLAMVGKYHGIVFTRPSYVVNARPWRATNEYTIIEKRREGRTTAVLGSIGQMLPISGCGCRPCRDALLWQEFDCRRYTHLR